MRVSWHRDERLVVLSLWQGGACTGTFRMPVEDAARLIGVLAADLADAVTPPVAASRPARWRDRLRTWFQRPVMAPVVPLRGRHHPGR